MKKVLLSAGLLAVVCAPACAQIAGRPGVIGTWGNCKQITKTGIVIVANVCRTITFQSDSTGEVKLGTAMQEAFTWQQRQGRLRIRSKSSSKSNQITGIYIVNSRPGAPQGRELTLIDEYGTRYLLLAER
jgi:hypothetical protein